MSNQEMPKPKKMILKVGSQNRFDGLIEASMTKNGFKNLEGELRRAKFTLTKADLWTPEGPLGQLFFKRKSNGACSIDIIGEILEHLSRNGERITARDFLETKQGKKDLISWAHEHKAVAQIFRPGIWQDNLEEMIELWDHVPAHIRRSVPEIEAIRRRVKFSSTSFNLTAIRDKNDLFQEDSRGFVPLEYSHIWKDFDEIIEVLERRRKASSEIDPDNFVIKKSDLLKSSKSGNTFLAIALEAGKLSDLTKYLEENGEELTREDFEKAGLEKFIKDLDKNFYAAAESGDLDSIKLFLSSGLIDLSKPNSASRIPTILAAAKKGHSEIVIELLTNGADPNSRHEAQKNETLLWAAAKNCNAKAVDQIVRGLQNKYLEDPIILLFLLTNKHNEKKPAEIASEENNDAGASIIEKAILEAAEKVTALSYDELLADHKGLCGLELLTSSGQLTVLFTVSRWEGIPEAMMSMAEFVEEDEMHAQLTGEEGASKIEEVLAEVNARSLKSIRLER